LSGRKGFGVLSPSCRACKAGFNAFRGNETPIFHKENSLFSFIVAGTNGSNGGEYGAHALPQASGKWLPQIENEMALRDEEAVA
jgi:hypothetical protein